MWSCFNGFPTQVGLALNKHLSKEGVRLEGERRGKARRKEKGEFETWIVQLGPEMAYLINLSSVTPAVGQEDLPTSSGHHNQKASRSFEGDK